MASDPLEKSPRNRRQAWTAAAALAAGVVLAVVIATSMGGGGRQANSSTETADTQVVGPAAHGIGDQVRTVRVGSMAGEEISTPGGPLVARPVKGTVPATKTMAVVLTDEQCTPDAEGVSRCLNTLRLPDGSKLTVRHPHRMSEVPCLNPGERVRVRRM